MLFIAQDMDLDEQHVLDIFDEALSVETEHLKKSADLYQQFFFLLHQDMFQRARKCAFPEPYEELRKNARTGEEEVVLVDPKPDIAWFREMRACLDAMEGIVANYLKNRQEGTRTINLMLVDNPDMLKFAQSILGYADVDIFKREP